jgi:hypothetical protein
MPITALTIESIGTKQGSLVLLRYPPQTSLNN